MVRRKAFIVIGLGFGDEGKGIATDLLCLKYPDSIVIRFNGGPQAGHRVVTKDFKQHVFSNLGSGTLRGIPTYWSKFCCCAPTFLMEECDLLSGNFCLYIDQQCPITTHYDILYNRTSELSLGKNMVGSCGIGFGPTVERERNGLNFMFNDLFDQKILRNKLHLLRSYYRKLVNNETAFNFDEFYHDNEDFLFLNAVEQLKQKIAQNLIIPIEEQIFFKVFKNKNLIFEGAQGILLDENFGQKPYVTKSNTSSKNALEIIARQKLDLETEIFYVTRCYQTRHGAGPFPQQHKDFHLIKENVDESNIENQYQGPFKTNFLNIDDLKRALDFDNIFSKGCLKNILITCLDHFESDTLTAFSEGNLIEFHFTDLINILKIKVNNAIYSSSNCAEDIAFQNYDRI